MSCETTLVRLEDHQGSGLWIDPVLVGAVFASSHQPGCSAVDCGAHRVFTVRGTPDEVHALLFPEEVPERCPGPETLHAPDVMQDEVAGFCERCDGPVYHRPGKPGEYDHDCPAEAQMAVSDSEAGDAR